MFESLCGQELLDTVFLTTTQWSGVDPAEGQAREDSFRDEVLWSTLIGKGATVQRFNGTRESGLDLIQKLMSNTRKALHIQHQIVRQHMAPPETDAEKNLDKQLAGIEKRLKHQQESLEKRHQEALGAKDAELNQLRAAGQAEAQELEHARTERRFFERLLAAEREKAGPSQPAGSRPTTSGTSIS